MAIQLTGFRPFVAARILIVDDEQFQLDLLQRLLSQAGYTNLTAVSDPRGVAALHRDRDFDLILLDIHMPHLGGLEVLGQLKAVNPDDYAPVIVMTGDEDVETRLAALDHGARDFLTKPPRKAELLSRIHNLLEVRFLTRQNRLERERYRNLLTGILPGYIVTRLDRGETDIVDNFGDVAVMFADLVGFSSVCARLESRIVVANLNRIFLAFDRLAERHGVEKIKTLGDAYMAVAGLGSGNGHFAAMADFALALVGELQAMLPSLAAPFSMRVGIERGQLIAGMLTGRRSVFDVWGDTVNAAARLQAASEPGRVTVSRHFADALDQAFALEPRGTLELKGVGRTEAFFLGPRRGWSAKTHG